MRKFGTVCVLAAFACSLTACSNSKEAEAKKAAEEAQKAATAAAGAGAQAAQTGAAELARGMQQFGQAMQGLQQGSDGQTYTPVNFTELQALLPDLAGWEKGTPEGEMMSAPVKFSQTEVTYTKGEATVEVKLVDTAMSGLLTMPYQMFLATGYAKQTSTGYEKAQSVRGNPGWEKWNSQDKHAETGFIVGKRFLVVVEGRDVDSAKAVQDVVAKLDLGKLASLK